MAYGMCIAMDCIGLLLLGLILLDFGAPGIRNRDFAGRMFLAMIGTNICLLALDMCTWLVMDIDTSFARSVHVTAIFLYYLLHAPMCYFWVLYCDYKLFEDIERIKRRAARLAMPVFAMTALLVVNLDYPIIYRVTAENVYERMPLYPVSVLLCMPHYIYSAVITLKQMRPDRKRQRVGPARFLLIYPLFPLLFVLIQSLCYGLAIVWMGSVISLLILYINLQNAKITTDALTGINNRHRFDSYFRYKLHNRTEHTYLFLLMIDIDNLKTINDTRGHLAGDLAIRLTASRIIDGVRRSDFVARISGDEFVVIGECHDRSVVDNIINSVRSSILRTPSDPVLSASIGYSILDPYTDRSADDLILEADRSMYARKADSVS